MVTVTETVPVPAGTVAVRLVAVTPLIPVPRVAPKWTAVAPVEPVPVTLTLVAPGLGPVVRGDSGDRRRCVVGELVAGVGRRSSVGGGHRDVERPGARRGGDRQAGGGSPVIPVPTAEPKLTAVAPVKLVPVTMAEVPPPAGPFVGLTEVTVGGGGVVELVSGVGRRAAVGVVTVTATVQVPAGEVTVRLVAVTRVTPAPGVEPKCSCGSREAGSVDCDAGPPALGPLFGVTAVTVGKLGRCRCSGHSSWSPRCRSAWSPWRRPSRFPPERSP